MLKVNNHDVPGPIPDIVLYFEPLLDQVIQVMRQKKESDNHSDLRTSVLYEHQNLVFDSRTLVVGMEEKFKPKKKVAIIYSKLRLEATNKEKEELVTLDLGYFEKQLDEDPNTNLERFEVVK